MVEERGLSYVVGVLIVLAVTLAAVVAFSQILSFQAGVLTSLQALDVRRLGESLVPVEGVIGKSGSSITYVHMVVYNNGLVPTCLLEASVLETTLSFNKPTCTADNPLVKPREYGIVKFCDIGCPSITPKEYVVIARTLHNKIVTFRVVFR
jgi:flagellin-like protein